MFNNKHSMKNIFRDYISLQIIETEDKDILEVKIQDQNGDKVDLLLSKFEFSEFTKLFKAWNE